MNEYNSNPDYGQIGKHRSPIGGDAETLCRVFEKPKNPARVERILRASQGEGGYVLENNRHVDLAKALGWPAKYMWLGYGVLIEVYKARDDGPVIFAKTLSRTSLENLVAVDSENSSFDLDQELEKLLRQKKKISAIILYQKHKMSSLAEAKSYVDELEIKM